MYKNFVWTLSRRMSVSKVPDAACKSCYFVMQVCGGALPLALCIMAAARRAGRAAHTARDRGGVLEQAGYVLGGYRQYK